ncbi:hypothetical protein CROQUDRAFT_105482 [Cronartium quercuum f. sp. fusiforme G11]|uniref:RING-type domain-containing protein n=1 Tax=Cronartium quercuum f. sp. fusiforme G11 TaxID=708437 RepID=A0A9P6TEP8_9BASI|nr:hypothetical protein CROQUDRAFT_105482 [Cronartium quercuum f. sp. fusiforme G11]
MSSSPTHHHNLRPTLQLRSNLFYRPIDRLHSLNFQQKLSITFLLLLSTLQIIIFSIVLIITRQQSCDQPLRSYLLVHTLRVGLALPCSIYLAFSPASRFSLLPSSPSQVSPEQIRNRWFGSPKLDRYVQLVQDLLSILCFVWFIIGNYFFFESETCRHTSRQLYFTSALALGLGYIYALEILILILAITFCLPIVMIGMRWMGWGEKKNEIGPLSQDSIDRIPLVVYLSPLAQRPIVGEKERESGLEMEKQSRPMNSRINLKPEHSQIDIRPEHSTISIVPEQSTTNLGPEQAASDIRSENCETEIEPQSSKPFPSSSTINTQPTAISDAPTPRFKSLAVTRPAGKLWRLIRSPPATTTSTPILPCKQPPPWPIERLEAHQATCAICLCDYSASFVSDDGWEVLRKLKGCGHCFHRACLDPWLKISGRCPLCQHPVT